MRQSLPEPPRSTADALYDDRGEKAGFAFADADLIGVPLRLVVSPKTLAQSQVEFKQRSWGKRSELIALDGVLPFVQQQIQELMALCRPDTPTA